MRLLNFLLLKRYNLTSNDAFYNQNMHFFFFYLIFFFFFFFFFFVFFFNCQNGLTALQVAAGCGNMEVVQVLLKAGANIHAVDDVSTYVRFTSW